MSDVESLKKQAEWFLRNNFTDLIAVPKETAILKPEKYERWINLDFVLPLAEQIADLKEKLVGMTERKDYWLNTAGTRGNRLQAIQKELPSALTRLKDDLAMFLRDYGLHSMAHGKLLELVDEWAERELAVLLKEGEPKK